MFEVRNTHNHDLRQTYLQSAEQRGCSLLRVEDCKVWPTLLFILQGYGAQLLSPWVYEEHCDLVLCCAQFPEVVTALVCFLLACK